MNLLEPGDTPHENAQFLLFLCAVIKAADEHQDLLRLSVATAGNDHRLGANEAPPAIISVFLGDELAEILKAIEEDRPYDSKEKEVMKIGAHVLPKFPKDTHIKIDDITLSGEHFKMISFYYSEYDGATRGTSQYFISFWKDNKDYLTCIGSNLLYIYDPIVTISNNIINIKAYKLYEPLSVYYYSFRYERPEILFHSIMEISTDGDNNTEMKYYYSPDNTSININSIFADKLIKK